MDVAEMFVSAIVSLLVENLASGALSFIPDGIIGDKIKGWTDMLLIIQGVLADAEDRQFTEPSVRRWLQHVQNLVYDIEDFVDDYSAEARCPQVIDEPESSRPSKLSKFFSGLFSSKTTSSVISFNPATNLRITEITNSLRELENTKTKLGLREYVGGKSERTEDVRLPSTSLVAPALVYGREKDSAAILTWLLQDRTNDHDSNFHVISIVGMGGIGKTTLAQSVFNNEVVKNTFPDRAWVSVTQDFDVLNISKRIYENVYKMSCEFNDLNVVQEKLREKLSSKKILVVLDDIWNEDYANWVLLCAPFHGVAPGSTIIVTTRSHDVAKITGSKKVCDLKVLSNGDCLSLLAQHAFGKPNFEGHLNFKDVGEVIAKRCKGLPLAAKSLGGLLRTKGSREQWEKVSTSKIWELPNNNIIPALRLSYHLLPPQLKPCFVYCSLFPKGYEFNKLELIMLWMAQGYLKQSSGEQEQMETLGCEYFDELLKRSFFQEQEQMETLGCEYLDELLKRSSFNLSTGDRSRYLMHDLNNDLAQFVAGPTYLRLDDNMVSNKQYNIPEVARHAAFISHEYSDFKKVKALNSAPCLRTLLPMREKSFCRYYLSSLVLKDFPRLLFLRALSFNVYYIREVPKLIVDLSHLRYLDFSNTRIRELPESVCDLYNLQTLLLYGCSELVQLPSSTHKLINLRHLDISHTHSLKETPKCIGMLSQLRTLSKFIIDTSDGHKVSELKNLHYLKGTLSMIGVQNIVNVQDVVEANLLHKEDLSQLKMNWGSKFDDTREKGLDFEILEALKSPTGLTRLDIEFYGGQKFPSWVGDHSFCSIVKVSLSDCKGCTYLPPLGQLASLKELFIEGMDAVKIVGPEFFGAASDNPNAFRSLEVLSLSNMVSWEEWSVISSNGDENLQRAFSCLHKLQMSGCMRLDKVSLGMIPSLKSLEINGCGEMVLRSMAGVGSVKKLVVSKISGLNKIDEGIIGCLGEVEDLSISECEQLKYLWEEEVACQVLEKLKSLWISNCKQLVSLGDEGQLLPLNLESLRLSNCEKLEKMPNWQNNLTSLRQLTIGNCEKLKDEVATITELKNENQRSRSSKHRTFKFSNLESVSIDSCPSLKWLPTGKQLSTSLRNLYVGECENMKEVEEGEKGMSLSLLETVSFRRLSKIKLLPPGLAHLTRLHIIGCDGIESIPETSLPPTLIHLQIDSCLNLKYMLCANEMQRLTSLRSLTITSCKNLEGYPSGAVCWPPKLETLIMGDVKQSITEWGLASLPTSLLRLKLNGVFPQLITLSEVGIQLPTTLTRLEIWGLENLESLGEGLQNLCSLQHLHLRRCPKVRELPKSLLPTLSSLFIYECPVLYERCKKEKRDYWPKISHIPCLLIPYN